MKWECYEVLQAQNQTKYILTRFTFYEIEY